MTTAPSVLLAEDEESLGSIISESLTVSGFSVTHVTNGNEALELLLNGSFSLAILDVMMPGMDGFTIARQLRLNNLRLPVLFLTSKTMPHDVVTGFESGGNDYIKKPFSMLELVVRMKALLGLNRLPEYAALPTTAQIGKYHFDPVKQQLIFGTEICKLTARESEILWMLYQHTQTLLPRQQLLISIWGDDNFFNARTLDVFITRLRKLLKQDPRVQIINARGVGYKLVW
ncbi:response regulator transcription factor [Ferruginibacter sp. HRS2-29]|uniref:response regulator transcription factor n=1 Tax=Ferruginibacter sp. HRS2-29 TaxID=2487334 RepID=UPI0020CD37F1|nr:DNA-binding response regulator [Ferruginibacter sp. HRS2-29]